MKRAVVAFLTMTVTLSACAAKPSQPNQPAAGQRAPVHVGATLNLTGTGEKTLAVTLSKVIDPATGKDGPPTDNNGKPNGSSYVAASLTIKNTGNAPIQDNANRNAVLIGSDNQDYTPDARTVTDCTNFDHGVYRLDGGESANGCVAFVLPSRVKPAKFKYTPASGFKNTFGEWLIP